MIEKTKKFWRDMWERVGATAFQAGLAVVATYLQTGSDPLKLDWKTILLMALNAAILAVVKSLVAKNIGRGDSASLDPEV